MRVGLLSSGWASRRYEPSATLSTPHNISIGWKGPASSALRSLEATLRNLTQLTQKEGKGSFNKGRPERRAGPPAA